MSKKVGEKSDLEITEVANAESMGKLQFTQLRDIISVINALKQTKPTRAIPDELDYIGQIESVSSDCGTMVFVAKYHRPGDEWNKEVDGKIKVEMDPFCTNDCLYSINGKINLTDNDGNVIEDRTNMRFSIDNLNSGTGLEEYYFVKAGIYASVLVAKPFDEKVNTMPIEFKVCKLYPGDEIRLVRVDEAVLQIASDTLDEERYTRRKQRV